MSSSIKHYGRIYTPDYLVKRMLDFGNYRFGATQCRHVIDNSCGNGAFLTEIVRRYIVEFLERSNDLKLLQSELETFVHGVEIDRDEYAKCLHNLDKTAAEYGLSNVRWDIINADALTLRQFDNKMDFVFGNPPYVRVHNLSDNYNSVKMYEFAEKGMTDLFIVFFEIGFNMLSEQGTMVLITPSSWLSSKAGGKLRNYIMRKNNLSGVIDLGHFQPFNAATYTLISRFQPTETFDKIDYYTFDSNELKEKFQTSLSLKQIDINGEFYLGSESTLLQLKDIKANHKNQYVQVKNGFATLSDKVFIGDFDFSEGTIDILKASTAKWSKCIFPYNEQGLALSEEEFGKKTSAYQYLLEYRAVLSVKQKDDNSKWYVFGRTQALKDVNKDKIAVNTIIKDIDSIKLTFVSEGKGVYSGLYILTNESFDTIQQILLSEDFVSYIQSLRKYKSSGYYTFSSKDLEQYLNYKICASHE